MDANQATFYMESYNVNYGYMDMRMIKCFTIDYCDLGKTKWTSNNYTHGEARITFKAGFEHLSADLAAHLENPPLLSFSDWILKKNRYVSYLLAYANKAKYFEEEITVACDTDTCRELKISVHDLKVLRGRVKKMHCPTRKRRSSNGSLDVDFINKFIFESVEKLVDLDLEKYMQEQARTMPELDIEN